MRDCHHSETTTVTSLREFGGLAIKISTNSTMWLNATRAFPRKNDPGMYSRSENYYSFTTVTSFQQPKGRRKYVLYARAFLLLRSGVAYD